MKIQLELSPKEVALIADIVAELSISINTNREFNGTLVALLHRFEQFEIQSTTK